MKISISSPTQPKTLDPKSILLIGPPGGGKTTLALQFPRVLILDIDRGLDGPERFIRGLRKDLSFGYIRASFDEQGRPLPVSAVFDNLLGILRDLRENKEFATVALDNLTMLSEYVIQKIIAKKSKPEMEGRDWGPYKSRMIELLVEALRATNKTCLVLSHEFLKEVNHPTDMMQKIVVGRRPTIQGKLDDVLGGYFTDAWRCACEVAPGGKLEYKIETVRTSLDELKNSLGLPPCLTIRSGELAWPKLAPYFKDVYPEGTV